MKIRRRVPAPSARVLPWLLVAGGFLAPPPSLVAQTSTPVPSDTATALPIQPVRTLRFTTDEGTWISLDVSPDGAHIVFDLLGDLYTLPIDGGQATRITHGMAFDDMPRWSPDGRTIAFISDRDGTDNLWLVSPDGSGLRKVTSEVDHSLSSPEWTPDGQYLVVRRFGPYPTGENYLTNVPIWMYHVNGGSGARIFPADAGRKTTNTGVTFSPDGNTMYLSSHGGGYAGETLGSYQVLALDRLTGRETPLTAGAGGGLRPAASPDGRWLVYATRAGTRTALRIRDLDSHEDRWLVEEAQRDDQEGYAPNDVFPGYAFTPDSRSVVFYGGGKIKRVELDSREVREIPFSADVEIGMGRRLFTPLQVDDGPLDVTQLLSVTESPGGDLVAFSAVGHLWTAARTPEGIGTPARLTDAGAREYYPAFSPDGRWIAWVSWSDEAGGHVWKARSDGSGDPIRLTRDPAYVRFPSWSPDGSRVVYTWQPRSTGLGDGPVAPLGELRWIPAEGGTGTTIVSTTSAPALVTGGDDPRVYFAEAVPGTPGFQAEAATALVSVRFDGSEKRTHAKVTSTWFFGQALSMHVAPTEDAVLVLDRDDLYLLPLAPAGKDGLAVNLGSPSVPLRRITHQGANYAQWLDGGRTVGWSLANRVSRASRDAVMASADAGTWGVVESSVDLEVPRAIPEGRILLRGARIVTMRGDEVLERGDVLVRNNRIEAVGPDVPAPEGARVLDVAGTTIIPGIVDVHAHPKTGAEMALEQEWSVAANLAYGVTTTRNPSGSRWNVAWGELIDAGGMVGSRVWATGVPLTSNTVAVSSYDDALAVVQRYKRQGVNSLKQYLQPRRIQRQWILQAALAEGMNTTNEGAADLKMDITMAMDGFTAIEHSIGQVPLYKDVVTLFAESRIAYTPTLVVAYGAPSGDTYFRARTDLDKDPKASFFTPSELLTRQARRRPIIVEEDYNFPAIARGVRDIVRAGGLAGLGSHGQQDGPAAHWELWMLQSGDMTPLEALRIATILGAESLGYADDLGSIEAGKLADLVILDSNPLEDIRNSTDIRLVMKNGELFEARTLDRIWPTARSFPVPDWVREKEALERLPRGR
jgi:Tol biopolymer transport system component/imidazolonepropionase-like amidohydrolase